MKTNLRFKWTVSRARDTYGYNICSLYVNEQKVFSCNGGGYDMEGTCLGDYIAKRFEKELLKFDTEFYGLTFHDPNYDPGKKEIDGQTIEKREQEGKSVGLERYRSFYSASSKLPTENHVIPLIDGSCGISSVEKIMNALGYTLKYDRETEKGRFYIMESV